MKALTLKDLEKELKSLKGKTAITFHSIGDVDALASAFALKIAIKNSKVFRIDSLNSQARKVWGRLNLTLDAFPSNSLDGIDNLIFVDVSTPTLLGNLRKEVENYKGNLIVIDHHLHNAPLHGKHYVDATKTSCSQVVHEILKALKKHEDPGISILIALGIISDTANLKSADNSTIFALGECLKNSTMELQEIYDLLDVSPDISEKIAVLEACKRAQIERIGDLVIASSQVSAFELKSAAGLISLGCDFAVVSNQKDGKLSALKSKAFALRKIHVGKLLDKFARQLHGSGGGHEIVGGANFLHGMDALTCCDKILAAVREEL